MQKSSLSQLALEAKVAQPEKNQLRSGWDVVVGQHLHPWVKRQTLKAVDDWRKEASRITGAHEVTNETMADWHMKQELPKTT